MPSTLTLDWLADAECRHYDPDWWSVGHPGNEYARRICRDCPVTEQCIDRAYELGIQGMIIAGSADRRCRQPYRTTAAVSLLCERLTCRKPFTATNARQRYCTDTCRSNDHKSARRRRGSVVT